MNHDFDGYDKLEFVDVAARIGTTMPQNQLLCIVWLTVLYKQSLRYWIELVGVAFGPLRTLVGMCIVSLLKSRFCSHLTGLVVVFVKNIELVIV